MAFGLAPAPEELQRRLHEVFYDLDGIAVVADDILIFGRGNTEEQAVLDHDFKLHKLLIRAQ